MLHTKFQGNWPAGSGKEDLQKVSTRYGHDGHLGYVTSIITNFHFHVSKSLKTKFG